MMHIIRPWELTDVHRDLVSEYKQLRDLTENMTPQARGKALEKLLHRLLNAYQVENRANVYSDKGEIDLAFRMDSTQFLLEAKWLKKRTDYRPASLLADRAIQRMHGTLGILVSMSGYTKTVLEQLGTGKQARLILFDAIHIEAIIAGFASPIELIMAAVSEASVSGRYYVPLHELLGSHPLPSTPPLAFGPPDGYDSSTLVTDDTQARIVVHSNEEIRGIAVESTDKLLVALFDGLARVDLRKKKIEWLLPLRWINRNPLVDPQGRVWILRGAAAAQVDKKMLIVRGGGFGPATLFAGPDGQPWALDRWSNNRSDGNHPANLVQVGKNIGDEDRIILPHYSGAASRNAVALDNKGQRFFIAGSPYSDFIDRDNLEDEEQAITIVSNPQGMLRLDNGTPVIAGDYRQGVGLIGMNIDTREFSLITHFNLSGSVSELAQDERSLYLLSSAPIGRETRYAIVQIAKKSLVR